MVKWVVTPKCENHRSPSAANYPTVLLMFKRSDSNVRMNGLEGNIMFRDDEFMTGVVMMMEYSPTLRERIIDYVRRLDSWKVKPATELSELLL